MEITSELVKSLNQFLFWNKARLNCFAQMIIALISVKTVNLVEWSTAFQGKAKSDSAYIRIKRFFRHYTIDFDVIAGMIFKWFGFKGQKVFLTLDRTNWDLGSQTINVLMLAVVYKGIAIPLYWDLLNKKGASNYIERINLLEKYIQKFGKDSIAGVLGDREFIGKQWFSYLEKENIPFYIRIKCNSIITNAKGRKREAIFLFVDLKQGEERVLAGKRSLWGVDLFITGLRCPDGDFLIIATNQEANNALKTYRLRWEIETLFGCLKTRGFNFEDTHMTEQARVKKLIAVLAVSFVWAHKMGEWQCAKKNIVIKKHGRKAESIFRLGYKKLRRFMLSLTRTKWLIKKVIALIFTEPDNLEHIKLQVNL